MLRRVLTILFIGNSFLHGQYQPVRSYNTAGVVDEAESRFSSTNENAHPQSAPLRRLVYLRPWQSRFNASLSRPLTNAR